MSQRKYRNYYEPWKLCFWTTGVSGLAAETCYLCQDQDDMTFCGALVYVTTDDGSRVSTIGGLVEVDGQLYAMTTSHPPSPPIQGTSASASLSSAATLRDEDFPDDVGAALVFTPKASGNWESAESIPPQLQPAFSQWSQTTTPLVSTLEGQGCD
ncbi:hypothetical protein B0T25DRAFT_569921 [Lasiosphaeria hispida]|uniref:Uncharacterized protein n=1 Tax=Lasiosphaeria hispida TaxID=260671 RepID=A0AAJ0MCJ5_9PEZI|nr:hypothetical protein B0T25DRAFT_569921 [Lasiosphaeria hispida]